MGGGGEECFPRTEVIEGEGDGAWVDAADAIKAAFSARSHSRYAAEPRGGWGALESGGTEARGVTGSPRVPSASEEGPGRFSPLSPPFPAPALGAGVLPEGFPVLGGGGFKSEGGALTAMATDCFPSDLRLRVLVRGFAALRVLKKPGDEPGALRVSRRKVNMTSLILASGRCLVTGTSLRALLTK